MKYICSIEINLPIAKVVELWNNENHFKEWQDGFEKMEHLDGIPNTNGAKARITFNGKHKMELIETIISSNLPKEKVALYEHIHMTIKPRVLKISETTKHYILQKLNI